MADETNSEQGPYQLPRRKTRKTKFKWTLSVKVF
jgi:hypothetical protein